MGISARQYKTALAVTLFGASTTLVSAEELTIATVNNADMVVMQKLSPQWEQETGHTLNWVILEENVLRQRVTTDIATNGGQFDVITIGAYEAPIWGAQDWLQTLDDLGDDYDYDDIFEGVRNGLSVDGSMVAVPFYAESSFTFYRTDLFEAAGVSMPEQPTNADIKELAAKLHDPDNGHYGICLRGKAGWGENMAYVGTLVNTFGGDWFDMDWNPQINTPEWKEALTFYADVLGNHGPPGASTNGHNENRALFANGSCAMWIDATSAAGYIFNPNESTVADVTSFAPAPVSSTPKGAGWFWAWALAIPSSSTKAEAAKSFLKWSTSKEYVNLVGETEGWVAVPPGTRQSTYENQAYLDAAPFAEFTRDAIVAANPADSTRDPVPYVGVQFVTIPEFQGLGTSVGQAVSAVIAGDWSVDEALEKSQETAVRTMTQAGYIK